MSANRALPAFNPNAPLNPVSHIFKWVVDGELETYTPAAWGVITYCIPRVHKSVNEAFLKTTLRDFFDHEANLRFDMNVVQRVEFVPLKDSTDFKKAFVYHVPLSAEDKHNHNRRISSVGTSCRWGDSFYGTEMNMVNRITNDLFTSEVAKRPLKVHFTHNGRRNFWLLLPNLSPLTSSQAQIAEQLTELSGNLIDTLFHIAKCGFPVPTDFDDSVLEDTRIDTAWQPLHVQDIAFQEKLNKLRCECQRLTDFAESNGIITVDDDEAMELIEFELDEEDAAIEAMHEERIQMDITGRYHNFPPPL
jgi:hypothetical protein